MLAYLRESETYTDLTVELPQLADVPALNCAKVGRVGLELTT